MKPELIAAIGATISAIGALTSLYLYRAQGKGFVWTKDHNVGLVALEDGRISLKLDIPLYNMGKGLIRFHKLRAKKINLKTSALENYEMEMDEAYFPEGSQIVIYQTPIFDDINVTPNQTGLRVMLRSAKPQVIDPSSSIDMAAVVNEKLAGIGEIVIILKCEYTDGSWFGFKRRTTTISILIHGLDVTFLTTQRRKELNELFENFTS